MSKVFQTSPPADLAKGKLPGGWRLQDQYQRINHAGESNKFRQLLVVGPGLIKTERRFRVAFNTHRNQFLESSELRELRKRNPKVVRPLAAHVRNSMPRMIFDD